MVVDIHASRDSMEGGTSLSRAIEASGALSGDRDNDGDRVWCALLEGFS